MNLPDFLWLWRIAAWSMGLTLTAYSLLGVTGVVLRRDRLRSSDRALAMATTMATTLPSWLRPLHITLGIGLVALVLLLLGVGIVGTLGHFGSLGHSPHLLAGLTVVGLVGLSAWSASRIAIERPWARSLHWRTNLVLCLALLWVLGTGWTVVQKYLP
ncbi:DUF4079 domain-containing protein [Limnothrix sp. FACHB-881]|uniref:DUF4079 domain-containing protein n=1 Tax=Limnothrix sp. FACHB-881 TaxID=2692819 RepID=UPI0016830AB3|nr:DUF4079 domain-containing protein [Limnothrix sp. FACHB-881]MBD2635339.1 DUF4079 domain-containing protein [Limnothrix sp. FACHB-881]